VGRLGIIFDIPVFLCNLVHVYFFVQPRGEKEGMHSLLNIVIDEEGRRALYSSDPVFYGHIQVIGHLARCGEFGEAHKIARKLLGPSLGNHEPERVSGGNGDLDSAEFSKHLRLYRDLIDYIIAKELSR